jgi:hypothetical protein
MRLSSLPQRAFTPQDRERATSLAKEMALFARLQGGTTPTRAKLEPGTPAFVATAKREYAELIALHGAPKLPASFLVKDPPPAVRRVVDAFSALHQGPAEVALNAIDGHRTYQVQVAARGQAQVLLLDARGTELARGVARGGAVSWRW